MTSPNVLRRITAAELVRYREAAGLDQVDIDEACELSRGSTSRYETCYSSMSATVARRIFTHLGVEGAELENLVAIAKGSRKRSTGGAPLSDLPNWFQSYTILEREASSITELSLNAVPGLLQTEDYARAVLRAGNLGAKTEQYVTSRMKRRSVFEGNNPLSLWVIIHEGVFSKVVGSKQVMAAQLDHLVDLAITGEVTVQVIPNAIGAHFSMATSFSLLRFSVAPQFGLVYVEHHGGAYYYDHPVEVDKYDLALRHLMKSALSDNESVQLIEQTKENLYS